MEYSAIYSAIGKILGGQKVLHKQIKNRFDLIELSNRGIPKGALTNLAACLCLSMMEMAELLPITERTLQRYTPNKHLSPVVSEHILQLGAIVAKGEAVFGDQEKFLSWMNQPNITLAQHSPLSLIKSRFGVEIVFDELGRIEHGVLS